MNKLTLQKAERIKVSDFMLLEDLARLTSIREVARLYKSTPAQISRRLKLIEKTMGYKIFERSPKGLVITGSGQEALKMAMKFTGDFHNILEVHKQRRANREYPVGIASTSFLLSFALIPSLAAVLKKNPGFRSYVMAFNPDELMTAGIKGAFHVAVHPSALDWPRTWNTELVGHIRWGLFCRAEHPILTAPDSVDLEEYPFVYPLMWDGTKLVIQNDNCPLPVSKRNSFVGTQTAEQAMHLIHQSDVLGFLPCLMMQDLMSHGRVKELKIASWPVVQMPIYLSVKMDSILESAYLELRRCLQQFLSPAPSPR